MIPESFIQDLLHRVDIVDVIDPLVPLKKAGANYAARCPFHNEKSPSFTVSPSKQFYHCFGCGAHGSAIGFLMEYQGLSFVDAIKALADRVGLQVPQEPRRGGSPGSHGDFESAPRPAAQTRALTDLLSAAARYYYEQLKRSDKAIAYLKQRGLSGEIAAKFGIGYAPDGWQNLEETFPNYQDPQLLAAGLVIRNDQGRLYDRFRDRIMIPIVNQKNEVIGFGGRVLGSGEPKYLNSPETPVFEKGRELFGLPQARVGLRETDTAIVVEGYMDVIALAQHGVGNAVATLGTATTATHIQKLFRQVDRVAFCFDGDAAGRKAAWRALENALDSLSDQKTVAFVFLPQEHDPDSFVRERGKPAFEAAVAQATPLSDFLIQHLAAEADPHTAEGRAKLLADAKPLLLKLSAPLLRLQLVKRLAEVTGFSQREVERLCELRPIAPPAPARAPRQAPSLMRGLIEVLLQKPELAHDLPLTLLPGNDPEARAVTRLAQLILASDAPLPYATLIERLRDSSEEGLIREVAGRLLQNPVGEDGDNGTVLDEVWRGYLDQLTRDQLDQEFQRLTKKAQEAGLDADEKQEYARLVVEMNRLGRVSRRR